MRIKYPFKFEQTIVGLTAFVGDIEKKIQDVVDMPVFVLHSGDGSYWLNAKFHETESKEIYECIPRFVIKLDSIELSSSDLTNAYNKYVYTDKEACVGCPRDNDFVERTYEAKVRRLPFKINCVCTMVSSSYIDALINMEILMSIFNRENSYTYEYDGNTYHAAYSIPSIDGQNITMPEMDISGQTRNVLQEVSVELQLHVYSPRVESIHELRDFRYVDGADYVHQSQFFNQKEVLFNLHEDLGLETRHHSLDIDVEKDKEDE